MNKYLVFAGMLLIGALAFSSCKKDNPVDEEVATSEDVATAEDFSAELDQIADMAVEERGGGGVCPKVTLAQPWGTWPNTITVDYGTTGCTGPNGEHVLKGKIIITQTAEMFAAGARRTKTFENFFVDDVRVEGTKEWVNNGKDASGNWSYTRKATDMKLTYPDGTFSTWNHTHTATLVQGGATPTPHDNVWDISGSTTGVNRNGKTFSATITSPLVKRGNCRWIVKGTISFSRDGKTSTLDFGNGLCDRLARLTLSNGDVVLVRLRR
jgi:hypothetical protein